MFVRTYAGAVNGTLTMCWRCKFGATPDWMRQALAEFLWGEQPLKEELWDRYILQIARLVVFTAVSVLAQLG